MRYIAFIGGGINSVALMCHLHNEEIEYTPVFITIGMESNATKSYINACATRLGVRIHWLDVEKEYITRLNKYGQFPKILNPFCQELKLDTAVNFTQQFKEKTVYLPARLEKRTDDFMPIRYLDNDVFHCDIVRPLLFMTKDERELLIKNSGCNPLNPQYFAVGGIKKVTCSPCMRCSSEEHSKLMNDTETNKRASRIMSLSGAVCLNNNPTDDIENCSGYYSMCE